jgi:prefoldin subunit 5
MAKSEDFYVYFDSNASTFVERVKKDLEPLKTHIKSLRDEMAALGEAGRTAGGSGGSGGGRRGGGDVVQSSIADSSFNGFFGALDSAAAEILSVTKNLGTAAQYQKDSAEQQKKFLQNLNNALRGVNRGAEERDPKVAEYESKLQSRAERYQKSLAQYQGKSVDEVKASLRQSDELKGRVPEGVSSSTPQTVRLADVPQVAIDEAAFNRVVTAVERNVQATKAVEQAINRLAKRTPRRGDDGGDDGGGGGSRRRGRDR